MTYYLFDRACSQTWMHVSLQGFLFLSEKHCKIKVLGNAGIPPFYALSSECFG